MGEARLSAAARRQPRHWSFASCHFDEANWTLTVDSQRVSVESKPLEILRELLVRAGAVVSKEELLELIWPNVTVVEASLPTAIHKLRVALGDNKRERGIIETVPGVGYRLAVPVQVEERAAPNGNASFVDTSPAAARDGGVDASAEHAVVAALPNRRLGFAAAAGTIALVAAMVAFALAPSRQGASANEGRPFGQREAANAIRRLDVDAIERLLAAGWNPNAPFDDEGNDAMNALLNRCEWDRQHDQRRLLLMARTLVDGGALVDRRNIWGDTAYSIAKADRYCGPNHPVTQMIRSLCYDGLLPPGDRCLASYELARRNR